LIGPASAVVSRCLLLHPRYSPLHRRAVPP